MKPGRGTVAVLGGAAASFAFAVGAVSLTRIAGDFLGFPSGLEWTLTAAVDVAGIAGGVMWTGFTGRVRKIGRPMNMVCTLVSGIGVGLDHATHAPAGWQVVAFSVGMFLPLLVTWILHALAVMADHQATTLRDPLPAAGTPTVARREAAPRPPDRELRPDTTTAAATLVATTGTPTRDPAETPTAAATAPRLQLAPAGAARRPDWITDDLVASVTEAINAAPGGRKNYGVPSVIRDHRLPDGRKIGSHRAAALLAHVDEQAQAAS